MSNKLKDIFSAKKLDLGGEFHFQNSESYKKFLETLQIVQNEGREVEVEGIFSITTKVKDGEMEYPLREQKKFTQVIIEPSTEDVPLVLNTEYGEKTVLFKRYYTTTENILETDKNQIVYFKISLTKNTLIFNITYRTQPHLANTVKDIVENYNTAIALLDELFKDMSESIYDMRVCFLNSELFFKRLYLVEQEFGLSFDPAQINDAENDNCKIEELYLLLIEKKVVRLNEKFNVGSIDMTMNLGVPNIEAGSIIDLTFLRKSGYIYCGQKMSVYTANLFFNVIVKEVSEDSNGTIKVLYEDNDSQPMYISYTGYTTIEEAKLEMNTIIEHKEKYLDALTLDEYMQEIEKKSSRRVNE